VIVESDNRPKYHLQQTVFSTSFHHKLWRNVLHYTITPYWTMAKDRGYRPATALDMSLELIF
jgi:hypothetical protein